MIRSLGVLDFAAFRTRESVSRQARSRSHFAGTRIFSYVSFDMPSMDAATVVTRLATRASAVASVSARRFVGNHRSGTPYRPAIATISLKRGWIIGSAAHPRATRQALGNRSAAILSKTSTGMLPSVESCLSNGGKNSRSVFAK